MKYISKISLLSFLMITALWSCKKDENKDYFLAGTSPVLSTSLKVGDTLTLTKANSKQSAFTFSWTNPNYSFSTGVSSQSVSYTIEADTVGANFSSPAKVSVSANLGDLSKAFTVGLLDTVVSNMGLQSDINHNIEFRLKSTVGGTGALYSNVVRYTISPYLLVLVQLPSSGNLYLVGSATAGGWGNPVPVPTQQFTKVSQTVYEIIVPLSGGQEYLMLPVNGDWSHKYAVANKNLSGLSAGGSFGFDYNDNIPGPTTSGNYLIHVDFAKGTFTVTPH